MQRNMTLRIYEFHICGSCGLKCTLHHIPSTICQSIDEIEQPLAMEGKDLILGDCNFYGAEVPVQSEI